MAELIGSINRTERSVHVTENPNVKETGSQENSQLRNV